MSTSMYRIYKVTNLNNNKKYIGWTDKPTIERRWRSHLTDARNGSPYHIHRAIRKHGPFSFKIEQIDECYTKDEKNRLEIYWIAHYNTFLGEGYNMTEGGEGVSGLTFDMPEDAKIRISESLTGLKRVRVSCIKCHEECSIGHLKRYHIDAPECGKEGSRKEPQATLTCPTCGKTGGKSNMLRHHGENGEKCGVKQPRKKVTCPHCGKTGGSNLMQRYHFDNCKQKNKT